MASRTVRLSDDQVSDLAHYVDAGMSGLLRARWRFGDPLEYLVAPIVLQVIIQVGRDLGLGEKQQAVTDG